MLDVLYDKEMANTQTVVETTTNVAVSDTTMSHYILQLST
jgi:hypothetical protein